MTDELYAPTHHCQYDSPVPITRQSGCTWTSVAIGADAATGGQLDPSPDRVHALVDNDEETNPGSPGWSMVDADKAMRRLGVPFDDRSGDGWSALVSWLRAGHGVACQGDSDRFGNATCSGSYDGPHCIYIHPVSRVVEGEREWLIHDPICKARRWEREAVLKAYATKLATSVYFGAFGQPVPRLEPDPVNPEPGARPTMVIRYVPVKTTPDGPTLTESMHLVKGQALYAAPGGARVTVMQESEDVPVVGLAPSYRGKAWRAVLITTKGVYADGEARPTVLYVPGNAGVVKE